MCPAFPLPHSLKRRRMQTFLCSKMIFASSDNGGPVKLELDAVTIVLVPECALSVFVALQTYWDEVKNGDG